MLELMLFTFILIIAIGWLLCAQAYSIGGEFYINGNYGRRKTKFERLCDGLEKLAKL